MLRPEAGAVEIAMGVKPLQEILEERDHIVEKRAELWARYGPFGTWDHERKIMLASLRMVARMNALRNGVKMTEAALDDEAHDHPDYKGFVTQAGVDRALFNRLDESLVAIDYTINRGQAVMRSVRMEYGS